MALNKGKFNTDEDLQVNSLSVNQRAGFQGVTTFSGTTKLEGVLELANGTVKFADGVQDKIGVASITPINVKYFPYTLSSLSERDTIVDIRMQVANTLTIPSDSVVNFPIGTTLDILQSGTGQTTVVPAQGVVLNYTPGNKLRFQWSIATLLKRDANTWLLFGDLTA